MGQRADVISGGTWCLVLNHTPWHFGDHLSVNLSSAARLSESFGTGVLKRV